MCYLLCVCGIHSIGDKLTVYVKGDHIGDKETRCNTVYTS